VAVNLDNRRVDHCVLHVRIAAQSIEYPFECIGLNPSTETPEGAVPVAKRLWQVSPRRTRANNPKHGFKEKARVATGAPRRG
jgi:hypothetical protein